MAYTLKLSNGTILLSLPDQQSDSVSTSLTLIGKNVNAYGADLNDNFVRLMENFASPTLPTAPLNGQLWFDDTNKQIKVYIKSTANSGYFKAVGSPWVNPSKPNTLATGDFWYDTTTKQMKFQADSTSTIVVGPAYDSTVGKSGWVNENWQTSLGTTATVLSLYSNNRLVAVASDVSFVVNGGDPNSNYFSSIGVGYNAVYTATNETKFLGTATNAEYLIDLINDTRISVQDILTDSTDTTLLHSLTIAVNTATLTLGVDGDFQFSSDNAASTATMFIGGQNEDFELKINSSTNPTKAPVLHVDGSNSVLGIFTTKPTISTQITIPNNTLEETPETYITIPIDVDINGNVLIQGDLVVIGTSTQIKTQDLNVVDKQITLAWTSSVYQSSDLIVDYGGIRIKGEIRDKWFWWRNESPLTTPTSSKGYWDLSDSLNLTLIDGQIRINGVVQLTYDTVYAQYAPNLSTVGALTTTTIANLKIYQTSSNGTIIGSVVPGGGNITIGDATTDQVTFANKKLWEVGYPSQNQTTTSSYRAQAATVGWVQDNIDIVRNSKFALTIDATGKATTPLDPALNDWVIQNLTYLYDPNDSDIPYRAPVDARARVLITAFTTPYLPAVPSNYLEAGVPVSVDKAGFEESALVIGYSTFLRVTTNIPAATLGIHRCIKQYVVTGNYPAATWVEYLPGGAPNNLVWTDGTW